MKKIFMSTEKLNKDYIMNIKKNHIYPFKDSRIFEPQLPFIFHNVEHVHFNQKHTHPYSPRICQQWPATAQDSPKTVHIVRVCLSDVDSHILSANCGFTLDNK